MAKATATGLGLFEYGAIPHVEHTSVGEATDPGGTVGERSQLCLALPPPRLPARTRSARRSGIASVAFHAAAIAVAMSMAAWPRSTPRRVPDPATHAQLPRLVFLLRPEPRGGGGGGGGGNRQATEPSRATAVGQDRVTVPVARRAELQKPSTDDEPRPQQQVLLDAKPLASGTATMVGLLEASPSLPFSRGPGSGDGVGGGSGSGIGSGTGPGIGPGSGGGFGGGAYRLGSGVEPPTLLKQVKPRYTAEAMRERIQGVVWLEVVVNREGVPGAIRVTRSLDPGGLDEEAITAAREWRFAPGRVGNTPVDVLVTILMDFNLR